MLQGIVYLASLVVGTSFLPMQSPKPVTDAPIVVEEIQELPEKEEPRLEDYQKEAQQIALVLGEQSEIDSGVQAETEKKPGPGGISEGLIQWLRQDKNTLQSLQIKNLADTSLVGTNGAGTQFIVYTGNQQTNDKVFSYTVANEEVYSIGVGSEVSLSKGKERSSWKVSQESSQESPHESQQHIVTVRTENIFGLTDIFFDAQALQTGVEFKQVPIQQGGQLTLGSFSTDVLEVIQFNRQLSEEERRHVETYLRLKYSIALDRLTSNELISDDGDILWDSIENKEYTHNLGGLIRNDTWDLLQSSSNLTYESNSALTISTPKELPDNTYILVGDNNKPLTLKSSTHPAFSSMLERTWKIEKKADVRYVNLGFTSELNSAHAGDMAILVGTDSSFSGGKIYVPSSLEATSGKSGIAIFNDVNIGDELYFTFVFQKAVDDITAYLFSTKDAYTNLDGVFGPGGINTNLAMWLRADVGVEHEGDRVQKWLDVSGKQNDLSSDLPFAYGTGPSYIPNDLNFNPVIQFNHDRLTDYLGRMKFNLASEKQTWTQFIVYRHKPSDKFGGILSYASEIDTNDFLLMNPAELWIFKNGREEKVRENSADNKAHVVSVRVNEGVGLTDVYFDGRGKLLNFGVGGHQPEGAYVLGQDQDSVGGGFDPDQAFTGDIAEVILFHDSLGDIDMLKIQSYLAVKYGITLPTMYVRSDGEVMWDDETSAGFNAHIAGLAHDQKSGLLQKISRSRDSSLFTMKNPSDLQDGESLMWGDNSASSASSRSEKPTFTSENLSRIWFFQEKGDVGTVDITFDTREIEGFNIQDSHRFMLMLSPDNSFTQSKVVTEAEVDGYTVTFKNVSIEDGHYLGLKAYFQR